MAGDFKRLEGVQLRIGDKGRAVLPAPVREAANVARGDELIARAEGPGRIVLETREAIQARVWAHAPANAEQADALGDVRAMRDEDNAITAANSARRATVGAQARAAERAQELLDLLGL